MRRVLAFTLCLATLILVSPSARAYDFDFSGTFATDNQIQLLNFTVPEGGRTITIFSSSWGNGVGPWGYLPYPYGGFDPMVTIWDSEGNFRASQDDGGRVGTKSVNGVSYTYGLDDIYLRIFLNTGDYTVSIAQSNNARVGDNLSAGFRHDGDPDFTYDNGWGDKPYFNGVQLLGW